SSVLNTVPAQKSPSDAEIEAGLRRDEAQGRILHQPTFQTGPRAALPPLRSDVKVTSERFLDRPIPQTTAMLLRESGAPLHVNEIYNRLLEGGFQFTGANPTISIPVSRNRNPRFCKIAPGTFDLKIRDASKAS